MNSNLGREVLADVLIAAAGAAAVALTKTRDGNAARKPMRPRGRRCQTAAGAVAGVVTDAARHFLPASLLAEDEKARGDPRAQVASRALPASRKPPATSAAPKKRKASVPGSAAARPRDRAKIPKPDRNPDFVVAEADAPAPFTLLAENGRLPGQALLESMLDQGLERRQ